MADLLQVLEGGTYMAFIVGAIVAVYELRDFKRDRKTELLMRTTEFTCTREWEELSEKFMKARFSTAKEAEQQLSLAELMMIADYLEMLATLAEKGLVPKDVVMVTFPWEYVWGKIKVWAESSDLNDPERDKAGPVYPSFKWLAGEATKMRLTSESKTKAA